MGGIGNTELNENSEVAQDGKLFDHFCLQILEKVGHRIKEVQIIQWFVQPGARVEQFDKLCEVASDKAITEITSRFDGVIKKLHYEPEDMAQVGKPLCDIDIQGEISSADEALVRLDSQQRSEEMPKGQQASQADEKQIRIGSKHQVMQESTSQQESSSRKGANLATPAVRALLKEHDLDVADVKGTGRDGRVLKEDINAHLDAMNSYQAKGRTISSTDLKQEAETTVPLTPVQHAMFKNMSRSLSIPHFLYTTDVDLTELTSLRKRLNSNPAPSSSSPPLRLTALPFIFKAVSLTLREFPLLNSRLDISSSSPDSSTRLTYRSYHNIGLAIDTPSGLLVPVIHDVASLTILELSHRIKDLSTRARAGKLTPSDLSGATLTISNIGNIGGTYVAPVIVPGTLAVLGIGKARDVLAFSEAVGKENDVVRKEVAGFCWSADHRILDGATVARAAERVRTLLEEVEGMCVGMR